MSFQERGQLDLTNPGINYLPGVSSCLGGAVWSAARVLKMVHRIPPFIGKKWVFVAQGGRKVKEYGGVGSAKAVHRRGRGETD